MIAPEPEFSNRRIGENSTFGAAIEQEGRRLAINRELNKGVVLSDQHRNLRSALNAARAVPVRYPGEEEDACCDEAAHVAVYQICATSSR